MSNDSKQTDNTQEQARIRELALSLTEQITSKDGTTLSPSGKPEKSYRDVEYVALIYRDGDELKTTRIYTDNMTSQTSLDRAIKEAGGANNVLAVVHNHPEAHVKEVGGSSKDEYEKALKANRLPSEADWAVARDELFGKDKKDGRPKDRDGTLFIIDPEGHLRGYEYEDRSKWLTQLKGPSVGSGQGNPTLKASPIIQDAPMLAPAPSAPPAGQPANQATPDQSSREMLNLFTQAADRQLPSMQQYSADDQQRMFPHAAYLGAQRGWTGIEGIAPNNATEFHRAGEFLCVAGRSDSPDPSVNGASVPMSDALKASPQEWLAQADVARQELAQTQVQRQTQTHTQDVQQSQGPRMLLS